MENVGLSPWVWNGERVLITGHTGFKGGWLSLWLQRLGANVAGYALSAATEPNFFAAAGVSDALQSEIGDVRDLEHLSGFVAEFRTEIMIPMAAQSLVRRSYADPVATVSSSGLGTVSIPEAARDGAVVRAVVTRSRDQRLQPVAVDADVLRLLCD